MDAWDLLDPRAVRACVTPLILSRPSVGLLLRFHLKGRSQSPEGEAKGPANSKTCTSCPTGSSHEGSPPPGEGATACGMTPDGLHRGLLGVSHSYFGNQQNCLGFLRRQRGLVSLEWSPAGGRQWGVGWEAHGFPSPLRHFQVISEMHWKFQDCLPSALWSCKTGLIFIILFDCKVRHISNKPGRRLRHGMRFFFLISKPSNLRADMSHLTWLKTCGSPFCT